MQSMRSIGRWILHRGDDMEEYEFQVNGDGWARLSDVDGLLDTIRSLDPTDKLEIRMFCEHKSTWNDRGIRICHECDRYLEVTSG